MASAMFIHWYAVMNDIINYILSLDYVLDALVYCYKGIDWLNTEDRTASTCKGHIQRGRGSAAREYRSMRGCCSRGLGYNTELVRNASI